MKWTREFEAQRHYITPKAFYSYCKRQAAKKGIDLEMWVDFDEWVKPSSITPPHTNRYEWGQVETICLQPFEMQLYLSDTYNCIFEFDFWDDKTGNGYCYIAEK